MSHDSDPVGARVKLVAGLLQGEAGVFGVFPEVGRGFLPLPLFPEVLEERLIGPVHPLHHILNSLGVQLIPVPVPFQTLELGE